MRRAIALCLLLAPGAAGFAEVPVRLEQLIYSLIAYNGQDYAAAFAPESSDTVYLLADHDTFVSLRKTFVYWWPAADAWQTDTGTLNSFIVGTLEITDGRGNVRRMPLDRYTIYNVRGDYEQNWKVSVGDEAGREYRRSRELVESYARAMEEYGKLHDRYLAELRSLSTRIEELKAAGRDYVPVKERMDNLPAPVEPQEPADYQVPPTPVQQAYIVNLPPGRYRARLVNGEGKVVEGSEKTIVAHRARRVDGIGYEVIPSDKWTRPQESKTPASILYVDGSADLYLRVFFENEYNELAYARTVDNAARGNPNVYTWTRIQQVPRASLLLEGAVTATVAERSFIVEQLPGASLGYTIVPFAPEGAHQGRQPSLVAFAVPLRGVDGPVRVRVRDADGSTLPGSEREIRIVPPLRNLAGLVIIAITPLAIMAAVLGTRARRLRRAVRR